MLPVFLQLIIIGHLKLYLLDSSVKYVNLRKNEPFVYTCNRYEKYIPQVGAKINNSPPLLQKQIGDVRVILVCGNRTLVMKRLLPKFREFYLASLRVSTAVIKVQTATIPIQGQ